MTSTLILAWNLITDMPNNNLKKSVPSRADTEINRLSAAWESRQSELEDARAALANLRQNHPRSTRKIASAEAEVARKDIEVQNAADRLAEAEQESEEGEEPEGGKYLEPVCICFVQNYTHVWLLFSQTVTRMPHL